MIPLAGPDVATAAPVPRGPAIVGVIRRARPWALICLVCAILYAPGLAGIPPLDRDEARFAQATRQMLETGDYVRIRFQDHARNKKPAGIYWLQAGSVALFSDPHGTAIWPYRLPSALAAALAALMVFALGGRLFDRRTGLIAALLLASGLGVVAEAHIAKTDAALLATVVAAEGALGLLYCRRRAGRSAPLGLALAFWLAEAAGILLKGPVAPVLALLTIAALSAADRDLGWLKALRPARGLLLAALVVAPWLIAVETATGGRFIADAVGRDLIPKLLGGEEAHGAPPFYYLALAPAYFWPGSLFLAPALAWGWRRRREPVERFLLAWLAPGWIMFELLPTKLPHYVLPLYPALALLAGRAVAVGFMPGSRFARIADGIVKVLWGVVTLGLAAALVWAPFRFGHGLSPPAVAAAVVLVATAVIACRSRSAALMPALAALFVLPAAFLVLPGLDRLWLSRAAAALVAAAPPAAGAPLAAVGYSEPSLVFLLDGRPQFTSPAAAAGIVAEGGEALVAGRDAPAFRQALNARRIAARPLGAVAGLDYSNGRELRLTLYRRRRGRAVPMTPEAR
jgi:4-amino-4-deoxy-L-arabinose transferase-like glycosyltransferase